MEVHLGLVLNQGDSKNVHYLNRSRLCGTQKCLYIHSWSPVPKGKSCLCQTWLDLQAEQQALSCRALSDSGRIANCCPWGAEALTRKGMRRERKA